MQVTFIIRNLTDSALESVQSLTAREAFNRLHKWAFGDLKHCVSIKVGTSNTFRDRVEANGLLKADCSMTFKIEPRRGYRLATFDLSKA